MSRANRNPKFQEKISQMRLTIAPIVHIKSELPPPQFPSTMLELFLLTEDQLDEMAHFYSQTTPNAQTLCYPQTMDWNRPLLARGTPGEPEDCKLNDHERLRIKMRMFARFIGMRGAETPLWEYERQIEIVEAKIKNSIEEEEGYALRKFYQGPHTLW